MRSLFRVLAPAVVLSAPALAQDAPLTAAGLPVAIRYRDDAARAHEAELRAFLPGAVERLTAVFGGPPRSLDGAPVDTLRMDLASGPVSEGESDVGVVRVTAGRVPTFGFSDWRLTVLHELVHLWNAESFRYADGREQWFNEGVAEFYAFQTATRLGLITPLAAAQAAATAIGFYQSASGLGETSLRDAGRTPELKRRYYSLVYHGGWTMALVLDRDVRGRTDNARSLDDVMRWMYGRFNKGDRPYTFNDVWTGLDAAAGVHNQMFFERHVNGKERLPVSRYFDLGALSLALTAREAGTAPGRMDEALLASLGIPIP